MNTSRLFRAAVVVSLSCVALCLPAVETESPATGDRYELPKMEVRDAAVCSFGIGIVATWDRATQTVTHLYVDSVSSGSAAETFGLVRGDEILTINGRKITTMKGGLKRGSDLFELLVNQPPGKEINIEVLVRAVKRVKLNATPF
jgi:C-terminal processing protease CtpA/Prc